MITGFNTDVKHGSKVYHVQTEDKGRNNPKIESLVYVGGEILDNYRTSYEQSRTELTEDQIMELLEGQHKRVVRAIKIGKYDEPETFPEGTLSTRDLDDLICDYLEGEGQTDHLKLVANGMSTLLRSHRSELHIETRKVLSNEPVENADIRVKLVATDQKPILLAQGLSDENGFFSEEVSLPTMGEGNHAVIIQAMSECGTAEQKYPLRR